MITNNASNDSNIEPFKTISLLEGSQFRFGLTGSRFFGHANSGSDYDFYTDNTQEVKDFLTGLGFQKCEFSHYYNSMTWEKEKCQHPEAPRTQNIAEVWEKPNVAIHVQMVDDFDLKTDIQEVLKNYNVIRVLRNLIRNKKLLIDWWNFFYALASIHKPTAVATVQQKVVVDEQSEVFKAAVAKRAQEIVAEQESEARYEKDKELLG